MFDLQHSKSNSPKRALTFFFKKKKKRDRETERDRERLFFEATFYTKRVWYSHVLNVNLSQVLQKKAESFEFFAQNWVIELTLK